MSLLLFELDLTPQPKKRPIVTRNGTYYDKKYQQWMLDAAVQLSSQLLQMTVRPTKFRNRFPLLKVTKLSVEFQGNNASPDLDNLVGAISDALVKAGVLRNDNLNSVSHLEAQWQRSPDPRILITLDIAD